MQCEATLRKMHFGNLKKWRSINFWTIFCHSSNNYLAILSQTSICLILAVQNCCWTLVSDSWINLKSECECKPLNPSLEAHRHPKQKHAGFSVWLYPVASQTRGAMKSWPWSIHAGLSYKALWLQSSRHVSSEMAIDPRFLCRWWPSPSHRNHHPQRKQKATTQKRQKIQHAVSPPI